MSPLAPAAAQLEGQQLDNGWLVSKLLSPTYKGTGGNFCYSYSVKNESGTEAHLKALDFSGAISSSDPARRLQELTEAFNHERDVLQACKGRKMSKIVQLVEDGKVSVRTAHGTEIVQYLICENAPEGDIRRYLGDPMRLTGTWALNCLHNVAVGVQQLHTAGIAHQDIKPSNVLVFSEYLAKLADLGRASVEGQTAPHDHWQIAADPSYAPPEQLYGAASGDFAKRRMSTDLYHLGSLISFLFIHENANALLLSELDESYHPNRTTESFDQLRSVLINAFSHNVAKLKRVLPSSISDEVGLAFEYLCHPIPSFRGHPADRTNSTTKNRTQRFVSLFDHARRKFFIEE